MKTMNLKTYKGVEEAVHNWHLENMKEMYENGRTAYKKALKEFGFEFDGYDMYGANCYSNGYVRVSVYYDHGDCCWCMEQAYGRSRTTDNFYNTPNDTPDMYGMY